MTWKIHTEIVANRKARNSLVDATADVRTIRKYTVNVQSTSMRTDCSGRIQEYRTQQPQRSNIYTADTKRIWT
jgi:hypothetical protein